MDEREILAGEVAAGLRATRELLADPARWTQDALARMASGDSCPTDDPAAVRWCLVGAVYHAVADIETSDAVLDALASRDEMTLSVRELAAWNDYCDRAHRDVLALLDQTLAAVS